MYRLSMTKRPLMLALALTMTVVGTSASAGFRTQGDNGVDPSDRVPSYVGLVRFSQLEPARLYELNIAVRRGRPIRIADCTISQSRNVIGLSVRDHAQAIALAKSTCG